MTERNTVGCTESTRAGMGFEREKAYSEWAEEADKGLARMWLPCEASKEVVDKGTLSRFIWWAMMVVATIVEDH